MLAFGLTALAACCDCGGSSCRNRQLIPNMQRPSAWYRHEAESATAWADSTTELAAPLVGTAERSMFQSRVVGDRRPASTVLPQRLMATASAVNSAVQSWSQSCPIEIKDPEASAGKMCASHAVPGREGMIKLAVWLEVMKLPSGSMTEIPGSATRLFVYGAVIER
jgi:hypothetical protein